MNELNEARLPWKSESQRLKTHRLKTHKMRAVLVTKVKMSGFLSPIDQCSISLTWEATTVKSLGDYGRDFDCKSFVILELVVQWRFNTY